MELTEFLRARLDEEEAAAKAWPWSPVITTGEVAVGIDARTGQPMMAAVRGFAWDAGRVLREVEAKRAIVALHQPQEQGPGRDVPRCTVCLSARGIWSDDWQADPWPCSTVRHVAAVWSGHADYDPAWEQE